MVDHCGRPDHPSARPPAVMSSREGPLLYSLPCPLSFETRRVLRRDRLRLRLERDSRPRCGLTTVSLRHVAIGDCLIIGDDCSRRFGGTGRLVAVFKSS